jgi:hypothetical protein
MKGLSTRGSYDVDARLALANAAVAVTALVIVVPLFWRGQPWQAPIAFLLLWLPAFVLFVVVSLVFTPS